MNRKERQEFLEEVEKIIKEKGKSTGKIAYELTQSYLRRDLLTFIKHIHPQDYKNKYPKSFQVFSRILFPKKFTWGKSISENSINSDKINELLDLLIQRPNEFIKRFPKLILKHEKNCNLFIEHLNSLSPDQLELLKKNIIHKNTKKEKTIYTYILYIIDDMIKNKRG